MAGLTYSATAYSATLSWDGGGPTNAWGDVRNWTPTGTPDGNDIRIGNWPTGRAFTFLDRDHSIHSLSLTNAALLSNSNDGGVNAHTLNVSGRTSVANEGQIVVYGQSNAKGLLTDSLVLDSASLQLTSMPGKRAVVRVANHLINTSGSTIRGNGAVELYGMIEEFDDGLLNNNGLIEAKGGNLHLYSQSSNGWAFVDLDGNMETGSLRVSANSTLWVSEPLADAFSGRIGVSANSKLAIDSDWTLNGSIDVLWGTGAPAEITSLTAHNKLTMEAGAINIYEPVYPAIYNATNSVSSAEISHLKLTSDFTANGGEILNSGIITFNNKTNINSGANFWMVGPNASLVVEKRAVVNIRDADFDLEGDGKATNVTTIKNGGALNLYLNFDAQPGPDGNGDEFDHTINLQGGTLNVVKTAGNEVAWSIRRVLNVSSANSHSVLDGAPLSASNGAQVNVGRNAQLDINTDGTTTFDSSTRLNLAGGARIAGTSTLSFQPNSLVIGQGTVSNQTRNNGTVKALNGDLVFDNVLNRWDGSRELLAEYGNLKLKGVSGNFNGRVEAKYGSVETDGFGLQFQPGSSLTLQSAAFRATAGTQFSGKMEIRPGSASSLSASPSFTFNRGSVTSLDTELQLDNAMTSIESGATFSGPGVLANLENRTLRLKDGADVDVLTKNKGLLTLGEPLDLGQVRVRQYQQDSTGKMLIQLRGTELDEFDQLLLTSQAFLGGALQVDLLDGFAPQAGYRFQFLNALSISNTFETVQLPALSAGLFWNLRYQPTFVELAVTNVPTSLSQLTGDHNGNGTVDAADYVVWRNSLGAAYSYSDYGVWRANVGQATINASINSALTIPEPGTLLILTTAFLGAVTASRIRKPSVYGQD